MTTLPGKSGVIHTFAEVIVDGSSVRMVVERFSRQIDEIDVIAVYAKSIDVGASAEIVAPSCTEPARDLAKSYGMKLTRTSAAAAW